jgi:hypothetical protein
MPCTENKNFCAYEIFIHAVGLSAILITFETIAEKWMRGEQKLPGAQNVQICHTARWVSA